MFDLLIEQGPPSEQQAAALMRALIGAVAFVHMHGIIHGDIKVCVLSQKVYRPPGEENTAIEKLPPAPTSYQKPEDKSNGCSV